MGKLRIAFLFLLVLSGCSVKFHLNQAKRHIMKARMLGAVITPDTVWRDRTFKIPAQDTSVKTQPVLDSGQFELVINKYDSVVKKIATLIDREQLMKAQKEINRLRGRLIKGFSKDSTYHVPIDSVTKLTIVLKDGLLDSVGVDRKETTAVVRVPVAIENKIECDCWPWWYVPVALFCGVGLGLIIISFVKR